MVEQAQCLTSLTLCSAMVEQDHSLTILCSAPPAALQVP
jgi:hypothetical protein